MFAQPQRRMRNSNSCLILWKPPQLPAQAWSQRRQVRTAKWETRSPGLGNHVGGTVHPYPIHSSIHHLCIYLSVCLSITYQCIRLLSISHASIHSSVIHPSICPSFPQAHIEHYGGPGPGLGTGKTAVNKVPTHKGLIF